MFHCSVLRKCFSLPSTKRVCNFLAEFVRKGNSNWIFKSLVSHFQWRVVYLRANKWFLHFKCESANFRHELYKISRASLSLPLKCLSALPNNRTPTVSFTDSFQSISIDDKCTAPGFSHRLKIPLIKSRRLSPSFAHYHNFSDLLN